MHVQRIPQKQNVLDGTDAGKAEDGGKSEFFVKKTAHRKFT